MLRFYVDNNVFQIIKPSHPFHNEQLLLTMNDLKEKILFCYSDAHLEDLKGSHQPHLNQDLQLIEYYAGDNYFATDINQNFQFYREVPSVAYEGKNFAIFDALLKNPRAIHKLFDSLGDTPEINLLKDMFNQLLDLPLDSLNTTPDLSTMDEQSRDMLKTYLPDYGPNTTLRRFWENNMVFSTKFMFDKNELSKLRRYIRQSFERDDYSWDKWQYQFDIKLKETKLNRTFREVIDGMLLDSQKNNFYLKMLYAYSILEMYNITEERSSRGLSKFTYDSLSRDAKHAYFAAHTDYLVTDDKGLQVKAHILYNLFNIPTKILSTKEFTAMRSHILGLEDSKHSFLEALKFDIRNAIQLSSKVDIEFGRKINVFRTSHNYFNYFNRLQVVEWTGQTILTLYCDRYRNANFVMYREIELLLTKLIEAFGLDDEKIGKFVIGENIDVDHIRKWTVNAATYTLYVTNAKSGAVIAFDIIIPNQSK